MMEETAVGSISTHNIVSNVNALVEIQQQHQEFQPQQGHLLPLLPFLEVLSLICTLELESL
jgi:hypothetical protein